MKLVVVEKLGVRSTNDLALELCEALGGLSRMDIVGVSCYIKVGDCYTHTPLLRAEYTSNKRPYQPVLYRYFAGAVLLSKWKTSKRNHHAASVGAFYSSGCDPCLQ